MKTNNSRSGASPLRAVLKGMVFGLVALSANAWANTAPTSVTSEVLSAPLTATTPIPISVEDDDVGDAHTLDIVTQGTLGTATIDGLNVVYTPSGNVNDQATMGMDTLRIRTTDAGGSSVEGDIQVCSGCQYLSGSKLIWAKATETDNRRNSVISAAYVTNLVADGISPETAPTVKIVGGNPRMHVVTGSAGAFVAPYHRQRGGGENLGLGEEPGAGPLPGHGM